eukprot:357025-Chlamydomonas_euryale.AAC.1
MDRWMDRWCFVWGRTWSVARPYCSASSDTLTMPQSCAQHVAHHGSKRRRLARGREGPGKKKGGGLLA